jgi:hypothetical protein
MKMMRWWIAALILPSLTVLGQTTARVPIPQALVNARRVFISNAGADSGLFPHPFSGDAERGYDEFYVGVEKSGRFQIVNDPSDSDLVLELRLMAPNGPANADKQKGASDPLPMFRLVIYDQRSHYVLWALTQSIEPAALQKTHDRNFDDAVDALVREVKGITSPPTP